ncbi:alpha-hydroxy-acid oxidizing protein [Arthrobacter koreensis]|uniref:alpha-hydroxy-acid oxidizing protein n=1 Tax=Arthrobacter koreensis TaxID=199136 RepID=UPI003819B05E
MATVPLTVLPEIRAAVGPEAQLILDSGIMSGGDIVAALAAGHVRSRSHLPPIADLGLAPEWSRHAGED